MLLRLGDKSQNSIKSNHSFAEEGHSSIFSRADVSFPWFGMKLRPDHPKMLMEISHGQGRRNCWTGGSTTRHKGRL